MSRRHSQDEEWDRVATKFVTRCLCVEPVLQLLEQHIECVSGHCTQQLEQEQEQEQSAELPQTTGQSSTQHLERCYAGWHGRSNMWSVFLLVSCFLPFGTSTRSGLISPVLESGVRTTPLGTSVISCITGPTWRNITSNRVGEVVTDGGLLFRCLFMCQLASRLILTGSKAREAAKRLCHGW